MFISNPILEQIFFRIAKFKPAASFSKTAGYEEKKEKARAAFDALFS